MERLIKNMVGILAVLLACAAVKADFGLVENFDSMALGSLDGLACTGVMGGTWDTDSEGTGSINVLDNSGSRCVTVIGLSSGNDPRAVGFNGITNTIDNSETGMAFFRFMLRSKVGPDPRTYIGLISDASDDPINSANADTPMSIPAGFGLLDNGSGGLNLVKTDGTTVLKPDVVPGQWYNFWIVANNAADTFDVYLRTVDGPAGEATLPIPQDLVESNIPFGVATNDPLTGMIFTNISGTGQAERIYIDDIYWDGDQGLGTPTNARNPSPADSATEVPRDVILSWTPGPSAATHDVYFGTSFADVDQADRTNPLNVLVSQGQNATTYDPGRLEFSRSYYWRIDEVDAPPDSMIHKGGAWQFTVEPFVYPIAGTSITATASSSDVGKGPENTVNGSGLDDSGLLHDKVGDDNMWLSDAAGPQPTWIEYEFDNVYRLHQMWVWNSNESLEPAIGLGFKDVSIEYSVNGTDYTTLGTTHEFAQAPGASDYAHNTTVDMDGVAAKYVRLTANSNWGGILNQYGLSEVRFFCIPVNAREPNPDLGETDVSIGTIDRPIDVTLGFRAGREAAKHDVYFSSDEQAVIDGTAPVTTVTEAGYGPLALDLGTTYYWRVDEVNEAETPATWQGSVWNFTTQEYFVVDDIESYNDLDPGDPNSNRIFFTWIDGWEVPTNGSQVGYSDPPFCEQNIVHSGRQSMPLFYDNSGTARYSEATMTLTSGQDWTTRGAEAFSLWFIGNPAAFVEEPAGTYTMTAAGADIWGTADEFRYAWKQLSGDGEIVVQVLSVDNTHDFAKAGVMIRNTLDADSANAMAFITPTGRVGWQYRDVAAGTSVSTRSDPGAITAPHWVKLTRQGNTITAQHSSDGVTWEDMVETANLQEPTFRNILMNPNVYVGLALTSHVAGVTCEAKFSNLQTTGAVSGPLTPLAIGVDMPASDPAAMYVALASSGGAPAAVYHDDPSASQIRDWTEWIIDLKQFADQGVNLANINTVSIGFGDKNNPQPGGSGVVFFDDIRLYPLAP